MRNQGFHEGVQAVFHTIFCVFFIAVFNLEELDFPSLQFTFSCEWLESPKKYEKKSVDGKIAER